MLAEVLLIGAVSGFIQGLSGFAFGLIATSLWAWILAPQKVVPLVVMGSLIGQCISILGVRRSIDIARVSPFALGSLVGVPLGTLLLHSLDMTVFRLLIGAALVIYCSVMLCSVRLPKLENANRAADGCVGAVSGVLGGACGLSGPPMILWCSMRGWSTMAQRATYQPYFMFVQVQVIIFYAWQGLIDAALLELFLWLAPVVMLSSWIGSRASRWVSDFHFQKLIFGFLLLSGLALLIPGFRLAWLAIK
ncbi:sulfite exporter TauE/SafE family protein [Ottowia thiooxydans]|uniref:sulfite exporter TauE/SafE family protein n=1 Tax=Ottowia thiooxydans TaxID=219182 RepID=UPI00048F55F0|nr:sulfite exporter TauE/SafE family protein [Ottowia thiooxydans]